MKTMYVYILLCSDGTYYTGMTNNIERRITERNKGINHGCYTFNRRPVILKYHVLCNSPKQAIELEKKLKKWSSKKKKALIDGRFELLHEFSKCKNDSHFKNKNGIN